LLGLIRGWRLERPEPRLVPNGALASFISVRRGAGCKQDNESKNANRATRRHGFLQVPGMGGAMRSEPPVHSRRRTEPAWLTGGCALSGRSSNPLLKWERDLPRCPFGLVSRSGPFARRVGRCPAAPPPLSLFFAPLFDYWGVCSYQNPTCSEPCHVYSH